MVSRSKGGFTLNIIDTPGLVEAGYVNYQALELIKGSVLECDVRIFACYMVLDLIVNFCIVGLEHDYCH